MNNRIYSKDTFDAEVDKLKDLIKFKATNELLDKLPNKYGELGHPNRNNIDLSKVTHIIKSVSKKKNKLPRKKKKAFIKKYGIYEYRLKFKPSIAYDIEFFDTKHGKLARELYNKKKIGCSIRSFGHLSEDNKTIKDCHIISVDLLPISEL